MFNYLEHFPHPKIILNQIYNNLSDGGVGIVEVPNFNEIVDERIFSEFIIDHLFYFNRNTLRFVLEMNGFEVLRIDEIFEGASLSATVKKRELISPEPFIENQEKLISDIDLFLVRNKKVAI